MVVLRDLRVAWALELLAARLVALAIFLQVFLASLMPQAASVAVMEQVTPRRLLSSSVHDGQM